MSSLLPCPASDHEPQPTDRLFAARSLAEIGRSQCIVGSTGVYFSTASRQHGRRQIDSAQFSSDTAD